MVSGAVSSARGSDIVFAPFRLDVQGEQLWRDGQPVALRPKTFAVLRYLVERAQRLVKKEELLDHLWGEVTVGDAVLKTSLKEIRHALGDCARQPRYIETAHGRGYRFIGTVARGVSDAPARLAPPGEALLLGREEELAQLARALARASAGEREVVFVSGEPGIGKTALLSSFLARVAALGDTRIARGRCFEQHSAAEAYLPLLEAFGRLCQDAAASALLDALEQAAPSWLEQMPALVRTGGTRAAHLATTAAPLRMLRELAEALDRATRRDTLILCLDDLQFADSATLDALQYLGQRSDPARLLIIASFSPLDGAARTRQHLRDVERALNRRSDQKTLALPLLGEADVVAYLARRFEGHQLAPALAPLVHVRTSGKPAFVVKLIDSWVERRCIDVVRGRWALQCPLDELVRDLPPAIVDCIEAEVERLTPVQRAILEAGSLAGVQFSTTSLARALGSSLALIEEECLLLCKSRRFLRVSERLEIDEGASAHCFEFVHAFQRQVIAQALGVTRRSELLARMSPARAAGLPAVALPTPSRPRNDAPERPLLRAR